jgi:hypothetical protein
MQRESGMSRRVWMITGLILGVATASGVWWLVRASRAVPEFYTRVAVSNAPPAERQAAAKRFVQAISGIIDDARHSTRWERDVGEDEVNGWLAEELHQKYPGWVPAGVDQPRVAFEKSTLQIGFEVRKGMWRGVLSARLKPWMSRPNTLAIEIESIRLGNLPVPVDELFEEFVNRARKRKWDLRWNQSGGHDVLLVRLDDKFGPEVRVDTVEIRDNRLVVGGSRERLALADGPHGNPR